jgi:uncharacterized RDD family membrane protein YckC
MAPVTAMPSAALESVEAPRAAFVPQPPPSHIDPLIAAATTPATSDDLLTVSSAAEPSDSARHDLSDLLAQIGSDDAELPQSSSSVVASAAPLTDPRDLERPSRASDIVITSEGGLQFDPSFASFAKRAVGLVVDTAILGLAMIPGIVLAVVSGSPFVVLLGIVVALIGFIAINWVAAKAIAKDRQWIGNRIAGTYVVDAINGANLDVPRAVTRLVVRHLFSPILMFGFIAAFFDGQRRTFHDRMAASVVIARQREVWTAE